MGSAVGDEISRLPAPRACFRGVEIIWFLRVRFYGVAKIRSLVEDRKVFYRDGKMHGECDSIALSFLMKSGQNQVWFLFWWREMFHQACPSFFSKKPTSFDQGLAKLHTRRVCALARIYEIIYFSKRSWYRGRSGTDPTSYFQWCSPAKNIYRCLKSNAFPEWWCCFWMKKNFLVTDSFISQNMK